MRRGLLAPGLAALVGVAVLVALGVWQLQRLAWKEALIARVEARAHRLAEPLPPEASWHDLRPEDYEFRHVRVSGRYLNEREVYAFTSLSEPKGPFRGPGYWVFTPLVLADGSAVFVNRGFVPMDRVDPATRAGGQVAGPVEVTGLMRAPDRASLFTPVPDAARKIFFLRDPAAMARAVGLARVAPFYVDAAESGPGGLPQGGETRLSFPNPHLGYALTWFGLAAALILVFGVWARTEAARLSGPSRKAS